MRQPAWIFAFRGVLAAVLLVAVGAAGARAADGDVWTLQDINLNSAGTGVHPSIVIVSQQFDSAGGHIEFQMGGDDGLNTCPGGSEQIRFSWAFAADVSQLSEGSDVTVVVNGEFLHKAPPCTGHKAAHSRTTATGTKGGSAGPPEQMLTVIDSDRFFAVNDTIDTRFAAASDEEGSRTSTTRYIHLDVYEPPADRPYAYFVIQFEFFGAGQMQAAYIYRNGTDTPYRPAATFTLEPGFDRPGSDYSDFDLPQEDAALCQGACAAEDMCMAFTYVKPGVQGAAPRCWLKSSVPEGYASDCCLTGIRQ
jgi:hypothetical protein